MSLTLQLQVAKPVMENEEGLNHLWVRWNDHSCFKELSHSDSVRKALLQVQLPDGIYRSVNMNGYAEDDAKHIVIDLAEDCDVMLELFIESRVDYSDFEIMVNLTIGEQQAAASISVRLADANQMEELAVNEQVVERLMQLQAPNQSQGNPGQNNEYEYVSIAPLRVERRANEYDFLVERYRIDCDRRGRHA